MREESGGKRKRRLPPLCEALSLSCVTGCRSEPRGGATLTQPPLFFFFFAPTSPFSPGSPPNRVISLDRRVLNRAVPWPGESVCVCERWLELRGIWSQMEGGEGGVGGSECPVPLCSAQRLVW